MPIFFFFLNPYSRAHTCSAGKQNKVKFSGSNLQGGAEKTGFTKKRDL